MSEKAAGHSITLGNIMEFTAWLSIATVVSGYIWTQTTLGFLSIPPQIFSISDYVANGVSPAVLIASVPLVMQFLQFLKFDHEEPWSKSEAIRYAIFFSAIAVIGAAAIAILSVIGGKPVFSAKNISGYLIGFAISSSLVIPRLFFRGVRFSFLSVALATAVGLWLFTFLNAIKTVSIIEPSRKPQYVAHYVFKDLEFEDCQWQLVVSSERYYYLVDKLTKRAVVKKAVDLENVWIEPEKRTCS